MNKNEHNRAQEKEKSTMDVGKVKWLFTMSIMWLFDKNLGGPIFV